ncbi:MAG: DUF721 domain-containing protein [Cyclobacteriaceae bacterium]
MKKSYRNQNTSSLKDVMGQLLETYRIDQKFSETELISAWGRLMGKPIANRTSQLFVHKKVLYVKLTSAPLKHELTLSKSKVLEIIRREFNDQILDDIVFK